MIDLPKPFLERMRAELGDNYENFLNSYSRPQERAIRVNTLKISAKEFESITPFPLNGKVEWEQDGYYTKETNLGRHIFHAAGLYYVQEPSAMAPAPKLEVKSGEKVLDLCSAPGGKGTQLAQKLNGTGVLVLNEINPKRYEILKSNAERLGVKNALITCAHPQKLFKAFESYFDKILVDAPCSGEGMFLKEDSAAQEWSPENVRACAVRQAEILESADKMLAVGGRLVYSTCTFAPEEDELQIENFLKAHTDYKLIEMRKLFPHKIRGEGHFYAVLEKLSGEQRNLKTFLSSENKIYRKWESETLKISFPEIYENNGKIYLVKDLPNILGYGFKCACGVYLGSISNDMKRFEPSHSLAMCLNSSEAERVEVEENIALNYLRGLTFQCPQNISGWRLVTFKGYPLGWCKCSQGVAKNHLPKGVRI